MNKQVGKTAYRFDKYCSFKRWASYYHQISNVLELKPRSILEIGKGDGFLGDYIKKNTGIVYKSMDIAEDLEPDIIGSVDNIPLTNNSFDIVCAFEVLEHLPFEKFGKALEEIKRVSKKYVVLSLPHWGISLYLGIKLPLLKKLEIFIKFPFYRKHKFAGEHYWEIGKKGYPLRRIKGLIKQAGFKILKDYLVFEVPSHHYFILKK